uniref:Uncharacterized protein n=1 Tax=Caudovirales sp. ctCpR1 TaxID=2825760 RepID=A0A8S5V906_9CAUD|nr:MAG TPA: hypothetical protein [Caudovirales sp. ctCpR1]
MASSTPRPTAKRPEPHRFWPFLLHFLLFRVIVVLT